MCSSFNLSPGLTVVFPCDPKEDDRGGRAAELGLVSIAASYSQTEVKMSDCNVEWMKVYFNHQALRRHEAEAEEVEGGRTGRVRGWKMMEEDVFLLFHTKQYHGSKRLRSQHVLGFLLTGIC